MSKRRRRDSSHISTTSVVRPPREAFVEPLSSESDLNDLDSRNQLRDIVDSRTWTPSDHMRERLRQERIIQKKRYPGFKGSNKSYRSDSSSIDPLGVFFSSQVAVPVLDDPIAKPVRDLTTCARREVRRQVLHALGLQRTSGGTSGANYNENSLVQCVRKKR